MLRMREVVVPYAMIALQTLIHWHGQLVETVLGSHHRRTDGRRLVFIHALRINFWGLPPRTQFVAERSVVVRAVSGKCF